MEAELVWRVWRRILREPGLSECLAENKAGDLASRFGFTHDELRVAQAYAATPQRTSWFVVNYRYRLVSSICFALENCAPLTWRLLHVRQCDLRQIATRYLDATGWTDDGPYVYRAAARALDYLRGELSERIEGLEDVALLDAMSIELVRSLADAAASEWPPLERRATWAADLDAWRFERTRLGKVAATRHLLSPWLREKAAFAAESLASGEEFFLVYLPSVEVRPKLARIGRGGRDVLERLSVPCTLAEILPVAGTRDAAASLRRFLHSGVVRGLELA